MQLTVAAAAFDPRAPHAVDNAKAALGVAVKQGADLIVLPGLVWRRRDISRLSRDGGNIAVCASFGMDGSAVFRSGEALMMQSPLYGEGERGEDVALLEIEGVTIALLAGADAVSPIAARLAALRGAQMLLCPVERDDTDAGIWAQVQQNGVFAAAAPASGEARVLSPLHARCPTGVLARGRHGTMAIARVSLVDWARRKLSYDPLALLNRPFANAMPAQGMPEVPAAPLKVAAVQRTSDASGGKKGLIARMEALCGQAKEEGCGLIAFPEYNWLDALGSFPPIRSWNARANAALSGVPTELDEEDERALVSFYPETPTYETPLMAAAVLRLSARYQFGLARRETARLAREYGIVVHGGTCLEKRRKKLYNTAVIAFPDGSVVTQHKLHPTRQERNIGIVPGEELTAFEIGGAVCCAPVCMDATYYEPFLAARRIGCDVAIVPIFNGEPYAKSAAKRGAFARAIENCLYIVKPALTGCLLGELYTGHAAIYGPQEEPIALSKAHVGDELVTATLDFERLRQRQILLPSPNIALEENLRRALVSGKEKTQDKGQDTLGK